ncbi:MAG: ribosomal protein L7/L12 [Cyanobacteriota bacterium]|nr:ribosomal protein L7/L12 [Cyanobacteriota bacterium]
MSTKTDKILEKLKSITMWEATELVRQIEDYFQVSFTSNLMLKSMPTVDKEKIDIPEPKAIFDVLLVEFSPNSLISVIKQIWILNEESLKEIIKSVYNLPIVIKSRVDIQEAEQIKQKFEEVGAIVSFKKI